MSCLTAEPPASTELRCSCERCRVKLYSGQPVAVPGCPLRELRGCREVCRPDAACSPHIRSAMHVGCSVLRRNGIA